MLRAWSFFKPVHPLKNDEATVVSNEVSSMWRQLAEAIQREQDPDKVLELVEKLNAELAKYDGATLDAVLNPRKQSFEPKQ